MENFTIKFWGHIGKEYLPSSWGDDFAVNKGGKVIRVKTGEVELYLSAHIFVNGVRAA